MLWFWRRKPNANPLPGGPAKRPAAAEARPMTAVRSPSEAGGPAGVAGHEGLREGDLAALYRVGEVRVLEAGTALFAAGDPPDRLYLLIKGDAVLQDRGGVRLGKATAGDWLGELDFLAAQPRWGSALTVGPASVLALDHAAFDHLDGSLQQRLFVQFGIGSRKRTLDLAAKAARLEQRDRALAGALYQARTTAADACTGEAVQTVIGKVPKLPVSSATLLARLFDERTTYGEVVELVRSDPALTSALLKAINSPLYGFEHTIDTVNHAVTLLGFESVHQLVLTETMRSSLPQEPRFLEIYHRSLEMSHLAFAVAQIAGRGRPAELSTIGLLNDVGSVVLELLKTQNRALEQLLGRMDTARLGAELLRAWNLPESLCKSIELKTHPEFAPPERLPEDVRENVALLYLADRCHRRLQERADGDSDGLFSREYMACAGLENQSETELLYQRLLPRLRARERTLPASLAMKLRGSLPEAVVERTLA